MKNLLKLWENYVFEKKDLLLPLDVLEFLVDKYTKGMKPKIGYFDFSKLDDAENSFAVYRPEQQAILINKKKVSGRDPYALIELILHEIRHFLQHILWTHRIDFRKKFSTGYKLPNKDLENISWEEITDFWDSIYSYEETPHEKDAFDWAKNHRDEAFNVVLEREKIKNEKY